MNERLKKVKGSLDCEYDQEEDVDSSSSFIVVGGLNQEEIERGLDRFILSIRTEISATDERYLHGLAEQLQLYIDKIEEFREGVACIMLLIADDDELLFKQVQERYFHALVTVGGLVSVYGAYEVLGFDKNTRNEIPIEQIREAYKRLSLAHGRTETPEGKRVRQAGYILSNPYGKKLYDAFLSGNEHLEMMRISQDDAERFGIDFMLLSTKLIATKNGIDAIKKEIDRRFAN